jgi:hypothetical protein
VKRSRQNPPKTDDNEEKIINRFYGEIVATRNYYSHYKVERKNVLEFHQMGDTINALKALIIMIFYSRMGMESSVIRRIIMWDSELNFRTMCLRDDGERPEDPLYEDQNVETKEIEKGYFSGFKVWLGKVIKRIKHK